MRIKVPLFKQTYSFRLTHLAVALAGSLFVASLKLLLQYFGIGLFELNPLVTAIISGNIFILGFLLNSTLKDYKQAERVPGEMATSLEAIFDECEIMLRKKHHPVVVQAVEHLLKTQQLCTAWFYKQAYTQDVLMHISDLNQYFEQFEDITQANFIVRMKNEQNNLRKQLLLANIFRDTPFYETSYSIAKISVVLLTIILVLLNADPFYEYVFFILVIVFITVFLVSLIKDLDDPYEYDDSNKTDEVSLKPLEDFSKRAQRRMKKLLYVTKKAQKVGSQL